MQLAALLLEVVSPKVECLLFAMNGLSILRHTILLTEFRYPPLSHISLAVVDYCLKQLLFIGLLQLTSFDNLP